MGDEDDERDVRLADDDVESINYNELEDCGIIEGGAEGMEIPDNSDDDMGELENVIAEMNETNEFNKSESFSHIDRELIRAGENLSGDDMKNQQKYFRQNSGSDDEGLPEYSKKEDHRTEWQMSFPWDEAVNDANQLVFGNQDFRENQREIINATKS